MRTNSVDVRLWVKPPPILMVECLDAGCWEFDERLCGCKIADCSEYEAGVLLTIDAGDCQ